MASINASTSGPGGIITSGDTSGNLNLQSGGTTVVAVSSTGLAVTGNTAITGNVAITGTLTSSGTAFGPTVKYVTDTTDIAVTAAAPTHTTVGSTFSVSIPTTGFIRLASFAGKIINNSSALFSGPTFGIRIASTNYWFALGNLTGVDTYFLYNLSPSNTLNDYVIMYGASNGYAGGPNYGYQHTIDIAALSVPTGTQTVQLIVGKNTISGYSGNFTLKGTTNTTRVGLEFVSGS